MYGDGNGVKRDDIQAYFWISLAVAQGVADAEQSQNVLASRMTSDQITEAERMAREWVAKHQQ